MNTKKRGSHFSFFGQVCRPTNAPPPLLQRPINPSFSARRHLLLHLTTMSAADVILHRIVPAAGTALSFAMYAAPGRSVLAARKRGALGVSGTGAEGACVGGWPRPPFAQMAARVRFFGFKGAPPPPRLPLPPRATRAHGSVVSQARTEGESRQREGRPRGGGAVFRVASRRLVSLPRVRGLRACVALTHTPHTPPPQDLNPLPLVLTLTNA